MSALSNVVPFPTPEPSSFADAWALLPDQMKKRSESKAKVEILWNREAKRLGGQADILQRLKTYLRDDKDIQRTGGPGLQVILRAGKLEHWQPRQEGVSISADAFPHTAVRSHLLAVCGASWVASYLDQCEVDGTTIIVRTDYAIGKLKEHREVFKAAGFTGMKKRT